MRAAHRLKLGIYFDLAFLDVLEFRLECQHRILQAVGLIFGIFDQYRFNAHVASPSHLS